MAGAILAMPIILVQVWLFISPGTTKQEKRYIYIFVPSALVLFLLGISFAWFVLAPAAIFFLANFMTDIFKTDWTSQEYISFVTRLVFWMGVSFQLPIVAYFAARIGVVSSKNLRDQWRAAIVGVAVLAAIITPSIDPVTMILTMAPLLILYLLSIGLAHIGYGQFEKSVAYRIVFSLECDGPDDRWKANKRLCPPQKSKKVHLPGYTGVVRKDAEQHASIKKSDHD